MTTMLIPTINDAFSTAVDWKSLFSKPEQRRIEELEKREQPVLGKPSESCKTNLFFGFFFDGTKNNYQDAETGKNHSNVARLYDCYPGLSVPKIFDDKMDATMSWKHKPDQYSNFFRVYIPGVASRFDLVGDTGKGLDAIRGGGSGYLGEQRIIWALLQAINNVHRYFLKVPLILPPEAMNIAKKLILDRDRRRLLLRRTVGQSRVQNEDEKLAVRKAFEALLKRLHSAIAAHMPKKNWREVKVDPGIVQTIFVSVFGFSRGATQARAFQNWMMSLCSLDAQMCGASAEMTLGGFPVQFDFLGLYDTVASVGLGNTFGDVPVIKLFDGHGAWADTDDSLRIAPGIRCVHLVAAHELRRSFPLDSISVKGKLPATCDEIVVPGVHSDLGSGYAPQEQGKGTDATGADMLARIALVTMYREARLAGVPLKLEFASDIAKARFKVDPVTINVLNSYLAICTQKTGSLTAIMREQARHQMEWRLARRASGPTPLESTQCYKRASLFDQNDFHSANLEFEREITDFEAWLKEKGAKFKPERQDPGFDNDRDDEWEEIATWYKKSPQPLKAVMDLFDDYVHDSRAWFKLIPGNPDNEKDMHDQLRDWIRRRDLAARNIAMRRQGLGGRGGSLLHQSHDLSPVQLQAADAYSKMPKGKETIPKIITEGREPYGFKSKAGYLRFRKIYAGWDSVLLSSAPGDMPKKREEAKA